MTKQWGGMFGGVQMQHIMCLAFAKQYKLPFILLSDEDKKIINLFGVPSGLFGLMPGRVTYVVDKNGIIKLIFNSSLMATKHISKALEVIKELAK